MWIEGNGRIGIVKLSGCDENLSSHHVVDADFSYCNSINIEAETYLFREWIRIALERNKPFFHPIIILPIELMQSCQHSLV